MGRGAASTMYDGEPERQRADVGAGRGGRERGGGSNSDLGWDGFGWGKGGNSKLWGWWVRGEGGGKSNNTEGHYVCVRGPGYIVGEGVEVAAATTWGGGGAS